MKAEAFHQLLSDPIRLRALMLLATHRSLCVCEIQEAIDVAQPKISRHLRRLREGGVIVGERKAQWVHYRLADELPEWCQAVIDHTHQAVKGDPAFVEDEQRLKAMGGRPAPMCGSGS
ncbi:metalloregulator ArsR/SmtB family transcription factor [Guyparkeria halopsychrophila]|uniref:ArsR/SmtB family transcription factor n=1 Tax=Guyparkeria halopsychrophila TaxID=3139421 RepID=UPI0037CBE261